MNQIRCRDEGPKRATAFPLSEVLVAEARALGINVSRACVAGLELEVREARVTLAKYRKF